MKKRLSVVCAAMIAGASFATPLAAAEAADFKSAVSETKPILDIRLRYEAVDQAGFAENGEALTARIRAGFETGAWKSTRFLIDFEHVEGLAGDYNSTTNGETGFPIIPDPDGAELNRLQVVNTSLPQTTITIGRQRIIHDSARFIGNVGWRQNEQTFDAVRVVNRSIEGVAIDIAYVEQVNRIFGPQSPAGRWDSSTVLARMDYKLPVETVEASVSAFAYLLDFEETAPAASSQTYGVELAAAAHGFSLAAKYARQSDYARQPVDYEADYYLVEASYAQGGFEGRLGYEVLGSDSGAIAFSTPLATLHKFNGFADVFLATPASGLRDLNGSLSYTAKKVGPADLLKFVAAYHDFNADFGEGDFGQEFNLILLAKFGKLSALLKYADYEANELAGDRAKFWAQLEWGL